MSAPSLCTTCGTKHHAHQAHIFPRASRVAPAVDAAPVKPVKPPTAEPARSNGEKAKTWRERDPEAYREYMRGYMVRWRAARRVSGGAT